tara:strand:- start:5973 stop:9293 length:3321 start_codon:yes stop_codon:yes gene_type:complete
MPSKKAIDEQNQGLGEQRDLMEEIGELLSDAVGAAADLGDALGGVANLFRQIASDSAQTEENIEDSTKETGKFTAGLKKAQDVTNKLGKSLMSAAKSVADTMTSALGEIGGILSSVLSLSIVGTLTGILGMAISKFDFAFKGVVKELGIGFNAVGSNVNKTFENMRQSVVYMGLEFKDVIDGTRQLSDNFGFAVSEAQQLSLHIADGAKALGVQTNTMATLVGQFSLIGDMTKEQAHNLSEHVGILAAQHDVAPQAVLQDMAQSTEDMALFSKGGVKNFAKTAIEARKLGMSVKDVSNSLKGMLNFEDSLNKELQASVMLGKNINLNEARRLSFAGDTAGAFQAIANELGDVDLGSLDPLTLQSVADAAGMSTENLLKMSKGAEGMGGVDMGEEAMTAQERAALKARDTLSKMEQVLADAENMAIEVANAFGGPIVQALQDFMAKLQEFIPTLREWGKIFGEWVEKLKGMTWSEIGMEIGKKIGDGIMWGLNNALPFIGGVLKGIGETTAGSFLKGLGLLVAAGAKSGPLAMMAKGINKLFIKPLKFLGKMFMKPIKILAGWNLKFDETAKRWRKVNGQFAKAPKLLKVFTKISKVFGKIGKFFKMVFKPIKAVGKFLGKFFSIFGKLGKGIPILGQILTLIDGLFGGFKRLKEGAGIFENVFRFIGGFVEGVVDGIIKALTGIIDWFFGTDLTGAYDKFKASFLNFFSNLGTNVKAAFVKAKDAIVNTFGNIKDSVVEKFTGIKEGIAKKFTAVKDAISEKWGNATTWLSEQKDKIVGAFSNVGEKIGNAFGSVYDGISAGWGTATTWVGEQKDKIVGFFSNIGTSIGDAFGGIYDTVSAGWGTTTEWLSGKKDDIVTAFSGVKDSIVSKFSGLKDSIGKKIEIGKNFFKDMFKTAIEGAKSIPGAIADVFKGLGTKVKNKISNAFDGIGTFFSDIGASIANMFPDIDFGQIATNMVSGATKAMEKIKGLFTYPMNKLIDVMNAAKNIISNRTLFKGKTLLTEGQFATTDTWWNYSGYNIPPFDVKIPAIKTPNLGEDFAQLHTGGKIKSDGLVEAKKGEVYAGAGDAAFKPIADEIHSLKSDIAETNRLLARIITDGIPVVRGV